MTMNDPALAAVVRRDPRYTYEAYEFLLTEALPHAQALHGRLPAANDPEPGPHNHVTGPELLAGTIDLARRQFGLMARTVFKLWGVHRTDDIGEIVFNLIQAGILCQSENDRREDFRGVFDLDRELIDGVEIALDDAPVADRAAR